MNPARLKSARDCLHGSAEIVRPRVRRRPTELAGEHLQTEKGPFLAELTPYTQEPLDQLAGRQYQGIVFVGPARTGKTMSIILGGITYIVTSSPGDMLVVQMSQDAARDFSKMDLDRAIRHSPALAERMSPRGRDDNTFDKFFRSGIALKLGWPAISQLSSKTLQYVFITDYDRPKNVLNVDGEGPLWEQARKRTQTYMSRGKTIAESSPGFDQIDPHWQRSTPHEAPPALGILSLYNSGTRARWYWRCLHCEEHFEALPGLECFQLPEFKDLEQIVIREDLVTLANKWAQVFCPHCGSAHTPEQRPQLNEMRTDPDGRVLGATWLHEGERLEDGYITGERRRSQTASYWLGGVAAAYQTWPSILLNYLQAVQKYARTGDESPLRATVTTDQGVPYLPIAAKKRQSAGDLRLRLEDWPRKQVPDGVRFLTAAVDVQLNRFVCQVMGWGPYLESWIVDRFSITASDRQEGDKNAGLDPAGHVEDWSVIVDQVVRSKYSTADGAVLSPRVTCIDSGGAEGVTHNAYSFWRACRKKGLGRKVLLVKGGNRITEPRTRETWPDARGRSDRSAGRGDVPVFILNVNILKDGIFADLSRDDVGPGYIHLPKWLEDIEDDYFEEMTAEIRTAKGWERQGKTPNESIDLHVYNRAGVILLRAEAINWDKPPSWAKVPAPSEDAGDVDEDAPKKPKRKRSKRRRGNWTTQW